MKERNHAFKERIYEIYGIPKEQRKDYTIHHIWFKSDTPHWYYGKRSDCTLSNLYPLPKTVHEELHKKVNEMR